jgi:2'-5' RNA ligase
MAFAVTLLFNPDLAEAMSACWRRLAAAGISRAMLDLGYKPHVTLVAYDELDVAAAVAGLDRAFVGVDQIPVALTGFSTFGAGSSVCYAALTPQPELIALQATVSGVIGEACRPHYQRGSWTPHCTLAVGMTDAAMERARDLLETDWRGLAGAFTTADLVEFEPVVSLRRWALAPPRSTRTP